MAGYSGTPLVKKLGIKAGTSVYIKNAPVDYATLVPGIPADTVIAARLKKGLDFAHVFFKKRAELDAFLKKARASIAVDGCVWVSWPKKASGVTTDITEDVIRELALPLDFVDVKVCAVDETWSGLKLMIRKEKRM